MQVTQLKAVRVRNCNEKNDNCNIPDYVDTKMNVFDKNFLFCVAKPQMGPISPHC
jgi:hypothetical protein